MVELDKHLDRLKDVYIGSDDDEKNKIIQIVQKLSTDTQGADELLSTVEGIGSDARFSNRKTLLHDIAMLKNEAMLLFFHNNQIAALKELYGMDMAQEIILDKAIKLKNIISDAEVKIYNINMQKFALLVKKKSLFDKYFSILKYSIFNNIDDYTYESEDGITVMSDYTVGIAYGQSDIFNHANIALQKAIISKEKYHIFKSDEDSIEDSKEALERLNVYKKALYDGNIIPYFQPIIEVSNDRVLKYEALARIVTDDGSIVTPDKFLTSAMEDRTFEFFTRQIMQKVFNIYSKTHVEISMNLTYENINSPEMISYIKNRLDKYGGERMTFEIVETEEIQDYNVLNNFISMVKEYGVKVSIDDFGSGYSNFTNLIRLNIDFIKIDGSLIEELLIDGKVRHMVEGIIQYSKNIDVKTIAEFVSSKEISDEVKRIGVDYVQGYHHGKPKAPQYYGLV